MVKPTPGPIYAQAREAANNRYKKTRENPIGGNNRGRTDGPAWRLLRVFCVFIFIDFISYKFIE